MSDDNLPDKTKAADHKSAKYSLSCIVNLIKSSRWNYNERWQLSSRWDRVCRQWYW